MALRSFPPTRPARPSGVTHVRHRLLPFLWGETKAPDSAAGRLHLIMTFLPAGPGSSLKCRVESLPFSTFHIG